MRSSSSKKTARSIQLSRGRSPRNNGDFWDRRSIFLFRGDTKAAFALCWLVGRFGFSVYVVQGFDFSVICGPTSGIDLGGSVCI